MDGTVALLPRQTGLLETADIIANNIANASTPGFKAEGVIFSEFIAAAGPRNGSVSMGRLAAHTTDFGTGAMKLTGGKFDVAINGPGYFKVDTEGGERLTRAGVFRLDVQGYLTDVGGNPVLSDGGDPVTLPPETSNITITPEGAVVADGEQVGNIGVFLPVGEMERAGNNHWIAPGGDELVDNPVVVQGMVEQSNVSPVAEFAKLIATQRLFEMGQNLAEQEHDRLGKLIDAIRAQG